MSQSEVSLKDVQPLTGSKIVVRIKAHYFCEECGSLKINKHFKLCQDCYWKRQHQMLQGCLCGSPATDETEARNAPVNDKSLLARGAD